MRMAKQPLCWESEVAVVLQTVGASQINLQRSARCMVVFDATDLPLDLAETTEKSA